MARWGRTPVPEEGELLPEEVTVSPPADLTPAQVEESEEKLRIAEADGDALRPLLAEPIEQLRWDIENLLATLSRPHLKLARALASESSQRQAGITAGLSEKSVDAAVSRTLREHPEIRRAANMLMELDMLENGITPAWKRQQLIDTYYQARELGQPAAATNALRALAHLDGDVRSDIKIEAETAGLVVNLIGVDHPLMRGQAREEKDVTPQAGVVVEHQGDDTDDY